MSLGINAIKGHGKPTENTQGYVGRHYVDMDTGTEYVCVRVDNHDTHKPVTSRHHDFVHVDTFIAKTKYVWEKYDGGGSGSSGGSSVQPDWNQNDETAPDYVKNRPFWTSDPVETVLFDGTVVNGSTIEIELIVRQEYKVTLDGVDYVVTAWDGGYGVVVIGSESLFQGYDYIDTEPPFIICIGDVGNLFHTINDGDEHTLRIVADIAEVHKIDEKYLSDSVVTSKKIDPKYIEQIFSVDQYKKIYFEFMPEGPGETITIEGISLDTWKEFVELILDERYQKQYYGNRLKNVRSFRMDANNVVIGISFETGVIGAATNTLEVLHRTFLLEYDETNQTVTLNCERCNGIIYNFDTGELQPIFNQQ